MCFVQKAPKMPEPPPLPPTPPPPEPPPAPLPEPEAVTTSVNPKVKEAQSKKAQGEFAQGTESLRIPLPEVGGATTMPKGGLNT